MERYEVKRGYTTLPGKYPLADLRDSITGKRITKAGESRGVGLSVSEYSLAEARASRASESVRSVLASPVQRPIYGRIFAICFAGLVLASGLVLVSQLSLPPSQQSRLVLLVASAGCGGVVIWVFCFVLLRRSEMNSRRYRKGIGSNDVIFLCAPTFETVVRLRQVLSETSGGRWGIRRLRFARFSSQGITVMQHGGEAAISITIPRASIERVSIGKWVDAGQTRVPLLLYVRSQELPIPYF